MLIHYIIFKINVNSHVLDHVKKWKAYKKYSFVYKCAFHNSIERICGCFAPTHMLEMKSGTKFKKKKKVLIQKF